MKKTAYYLKLLFGNRYDELCDCLSRNCWAIEYASEEAMEVLLRRTSLSPEVAYHICCYHYLDSTARQRMVDIMATDPSVAVEAYRELDLTDQERQQLFNVVVVDPENVWRLFDSYPILSDNNRQQLVATALGSPALSASLYVKSDVSGADKEQLLEVALQDMEQSYKLLIDHRVIPHHRDRLLSVQDVDYMMSLWTMHHDKFSPDQLARISATLVSNPVRTRQLIVQHHLPEGYKFEYILPLITQLQE